jgi:hypothetical protein
MEIMDRKAKRKYAIINFLPIVAFLIAGVYYLFLLSPLMRDKNLEDHFTVNTITANNWDTLLIMMSIGGILTLVALLYDLVHLGRIKNMNGASKAVWVAVLALLAPISFILFYFLEIRHEPKHLETYPDIA